MDSEGRFYFGGVSATSPQDDDHRFSTAVVAIRLGPEGGLDPTFSGDGLARTKLGQAQGNEYEDIEMRGRYGTEPVVGPDGQVRYSVIGELDWTADDVVAVVRRLLP